MNVRTRRHHLVFLFVILSCFVIYAHRSSQTSKEADIKYTPAGQGDSRKAARPVVPQSGGLEMASSVISSGGGTITGGNLSLTGAIGQSVVGLSSGGNFVLSSGFLRADLPDLTATKTNNVGGNATTGHGWTWTIHIANSGFVSAVFNNGQSILLDNMPVGTTIAYSFLGLGPNPIGLTGSENIHCNLASTDLHCSASGGDVTLSPGGSFDILVSVAASAAATYNNPASSGVCAVNPDGDAVEVDLSNNACSDSVTVTQSPATVYTDPNGVCGGQSNCFTSITVALNVVDPNGFVEVGAGFYNENVSITSPVTMTLQGQVSLMDFSLSAGTVNGSSSIISIAGQWQNNGGTFNADTSTVSFVGDDAENPQLIGGSVTTSFYNLTINNSGAGVAFANNQVVNHLLILTSDLDTTSSFTLTMPGTASSAGSGDIIGNVKRTGFTLGQPLSFGNPFNTIAITSTSTPNDITITLTKTVPTDSSTGQSNSGFPNAIKRTYVINPNGGTGFSATLQLHYLPAELNGNAEGSLSLWRFDSSTGIWTNKGADSHDLANHSVTKSGITEFSPWTLNSSVPTKVDLDSATVIQEANSTLIEWRTGFEINNLGFNVYREANGERAKINPSLIAGSALMVGSDVRVESGNGYSWLDNAADSSATYWLEDVDLDGRSVWHGPYGVTPSDRVGSSRARSMLLSDLNKTISKQNAPVAQQEYPAGLMSTSSSSVTALAITSGRTPSRQSALSSALTRQWSIASQSALKIAINKSGWYHLNMIDLMATGLSTGANPQTLQMFVGGTEIPIKVNARNSGMLSPDDSIEFYGSAIDTPTSDTQIYWLVAGTQTGKRIGIQQSPGSTNSNGPSSFRYTVERKDRRLYFSSLRNGDAENWFGSVVNSNPVSQSLNVHHLDQSSASQAEVEIALQGVTTNSHQVKVMLNGLVIASISFDGMSHKAFKLSIPQSSLTEGSNQITLTAESAGDVSLIDYIRITYAHSYRADSNSLLASAASMQPVQISGFTSNQIRAIDVANPSQPVEVEGTIAGDAGNYSISIGPARRRDLLVFTPDQMLQPLSITANQPSALNKGGMADYLIITSKEIEPGIQPFAVFKQSEGYAVAVVDVANIYDEFSYGVHSPYAVKDFLNWTYLHWHKQPQYVLLAGSGSLDPKNYTGLGDTDLVPVKLIDTANMETASDDWFVDFNNDAIPQMSIGRLPVRNVTDISDLVNKIISYERSGKAESAVLVSDISDNADFNTPNTQLGAMIASQMKVVSIVRGQQNTDARTELINQLLEGGKIINYAGHGSVNLWRGNLLTSSDAQLLSNQKASPLLVTMTCLNAYFVDPRASSLGESLIRVHNGGAVSVWASSGMTDAGNQSVMNLEFFRQLFTSSNITIGQAIRAAKASTNDNDVRRTWILFGDPTMRIK